MAWNEDGWRLAREAFGSIVRAITSVEAATAVLTEENPELAQRLARAAGTRATRLATLARRVTQFGDELPTTEPEARRAIEAAQLWKAQFTQLDSYMAEQARLGRQGLTLADHGALGPAGWTDARLHVQDVSWAAVAALMRVPQAGRPAPAAPRDPTRPRRRGGMQGMQGLLPLAFLFVVMMSTQRR